MDCLYAKCNLLKILGFPLINTCNLTKGIPYVTDCVIAELEKLGQKYRIALSILKDPRFERLVCSHKGTYADDCIVQRITQVRAHRPFF